ncbi:MAG: hypothetical protein GY708_00235 [Actinomycetia bacterium]|nr:hypothetical protein [Actinomycetes bacterium]
MTTLAKKLNPLRRLGRQQDPTPETRHPQESAKGADHRRMLIETLAFEIVPMKSLDAARVHLPAGCPVSVTCSPAKGIEVTQRLTEEFLSEGYDAIPHFSARLVRDLEHTRQLAAWLKANEIRKLFVVGGDAEEPAGYTDTVSFLTDLLGTDHGLDRIGVTAYPDSHPLISDESLHEALYAKQSLFHEAGVDGWCSTQMCFEPQMIERWLRAERDRGFTLPVHLGVAGVVDKTKLLTMGARLGIGQSLRYLSKNRHAVTKMMTQHSYDPNDLLIPLSDTNLELGVESVHLFTFNQVESSQAWRQESLSR